jgi:hypothetical protein
MKPISRSKSDPAVSYDEFKEYEGQKYTGMKKDVIVELERQQPAKKPGATPKRQEHKTVTGQLARRRTIKRSA